MTFFMLALGLAQGGATLEIPHEKYHLDNGMEVILAPDDSLPLVSVNIWYHVSPIHETAGRTGFAHLFEHLMFQGSKHVGDDQHLAILQSVGATDLNATTGYDRTNYFQTVPAHQLETVLWLESDRMGFLLDTLTQEKLDNQRAVVKNERRQSLENAPYGPSGEALTHLLYPHGHPYYGQIIGSMKDLNAATLDDVKQFFQKYYAPSNATMVIAGKFDTQSTKDLVAKYFGTLRQAKKPKFPNIGEVSLIKEERQVIEEPVQLPKIQFAWFSPAFFKPGDADCDVLSLVLGGGKSSRLYKHLVYDLQIAQNVSAHQSSHQLTSVFYVTVTGKPGVDLKKLEAETQKVIDQIKKELVTERDVTQARNQLLTGAVRGLQSLGGFGGKADALNRYNHYLGMPAYLAKDLGRYDKVTPKSVQDIANKVLKNDARAIVITIPKQGKGSTT